MKINFFERGLIYFLLMFLSFTAMAQSGVLSGKIFDEKTGETLIGASVEVLQAEALVQGTVTDFDGNYNLEVRAGTYQVRISYVGYSNQMITDVVIIDGGLNNLDVALKDESQTLTEVVVKATAVKTSEVAVLALRRKAVTIQDGISSQQITRTGSSNAADAMRQMTGAVVEGGRFIVVRGLGDRYSISQLNGITLPSTDPYRNSTSLDLIPAQMIENIISVKTFTPDLPGNFSGGLVNIATKKFPDKFNFNFSINSNYNTQSSLIDNFRGHPSAGKYDWLGLDDGSRDQPDLFLDPGTRDILSSSVYLSARAPGNDEVRSIFEESSKSLSNEFIPTMRSTPLNYGLNFSVGDRLSLFGNDLGYTLAVNYASNYSHYDNGEVGTYINTNSEQLFDYQNLKESKSVQNPSLGGLLNLAYKFSDNHALNGNIIFNNDAEIIGRSQEGRYLGQVSNSLAEFHTESMEFIQRQVATYQFGGTHLFPGLNNMEIEWNLASTNSFQNEPDLRYFAYTEVCEANGNGEMDCEYFINNAEYAFPYHFFRKLNDQAQEGKLDISIPFLTRGNAGNSNRIKFGGLYSTTDRSFEEYRYQLNNTGVPADRNFTVFDGNFDAFWDPRNFGIIDTLYNTDGSVQRYVTGYHYINQINAKNFYSGKQDIAAAYAMLIYNLGPALKVVGGARLESTDIEVISQDPNVPVGKIDQTDLLYSANLIYNLSEKANLRAAASKTLARPNMRELAPFVQFDTKNGFFNVGNPNLKRTLIQNYDLRYEFYPRSGELLALSAFYKRFQDPIIRAFNPRATIPELSFINVDEATVLGAELELRKGLDFISPKLNNFYFSTNIALISSVYDIPQDEIENSKNIDPDYDQTTRPFQGQAPFIVNAILSYINPDAGWEASASFNVTGQKLYNISLFATPDVYEQPYPLLDLKLSKRIGNFYNISFTARNILNSINKKSQVFMGREYIAESYLPGTSLGLSLSYSIK